MSPFDDYRAQDVRDLIAAFPLAWICPRGGDGLCASLLPLIGEYDSVGELTYLIGHLARHNPLCDELHRNSSAIALFTGPNQYVSPRDVGDRSWGPTWNYAQLRVEVDIVLDPDFTARALDVLVGAMEGGQPDPWNKSELGERFEPMVQRIIGFRARVVRSAAKFKLGQDERPSVVERIVETAKDPIMKHWVRRFNGSRS